MQGLRWASAVREGWRAWRKRSFEATIPRNPRRHRPMPGAWTRSLSGLDHARRLVVEFDAIVPGLDVELVLYLGVSDQPARAVLLWSATGRVVREVAVGRA